MLFFYFQCWLAGDNEKKHRIRSPPNKKFSLYIYVLHWVYGICIEVDWRISPPPPPPHTPTLSQFHRTVTNRTRAKFPWFRFTIIDALCPAELCPLRALIYERTNWPFGISITVCLNALITLVYLARFFNYEITRREFLREIIYKNIAIIAIQHGKFILSTPLAIFPILLGEIHSSPSGKFPYTY